MKSRPKINNKRKIIYSIILFVLILGGSVAAFIIVNGAISNQTANEKTPAGKSNTEVQREEELKNNPEEKTENQADTPAQPSVNDQTGKQNVTVLVTGADVYDENVEARGFVTDTVEDSGTCTYVFSDGTSTLTKTSTPLTNSTSTTCQTVKFGVNELSPGKWTVLLQFNSNVSSGESTKYEFIVP